LIIYFFPFPQRTLQKF